MTRFIDGQPQTVWYSQHDVSHVLIIAISLRPTNSWKSGSTYTWDSLTKNGTRNVVYSALGGHPNYPNPGIHQRNESIIVLNDTTSAGPLWDPVKSAYFYTFTPASANNRAIQAAGSTPDAPTDWLYFFGRWGDKEYNDTNPIQFNFANLEHTWDDGPTGPLNKDLDRTETCPDRVSPCPTISKLPAASGDTMPSQTVSRTKTATVASTTSEQAATSTSASGASSGSPSGSASGSASSSSPSGGFAPRHGFGSKEIWTAAGVGAGLYLF